MPMQILSKIVGRTRRLLVNGGSSLVDSRLVGAIKPCFEALEQRKLMAADPIAVNDTLPATPGVNTLNVLANDSDPDLDAISIVSTTAAAHGTVVNQGSNILYTADYLYHGADTFTYTITDGTTTATATVNLTVGGAGLDYDPTNIGGPRTALVVWGTAGNDSLRLTTDAFGQVHTQINGVEGANYYSEGLLSRLIVYGDAGNDLILTTSTVPTLFYGGQGHDNISGAASTDIIVGGDNNDTCIGGIGRDFIIGGLGSDTLNTGFDDDILVSDGTVYDTPTIANQQSLIAISNEWKSAATFATRVAHIRGTTPGGLNGSNVINSTKIQKDTASDLLTGGPQQDLFFYVGGGKTGDKLTDASKKTDTSVNG